MRQAQADGEPCAVPALCCPRVTPRQEEDTVRSPGWGVASAGPTLAMAVADAVEAGLQPVQDARVHEARLERLRLVELPVDLRPDGAGVQAGRLRVVVGREGVLDVV